jgi:hypothetical protein
MTTNTNGYEVTPAVVFKDHPEWPAYEAPARWYIQTGERFGK